MSQRISKPSAPYRSPFGNRRDGVPAGPSQSARRLRRSHLPSACTTMAIPPLRQPRPGALRSTPTPKQPPTCPVTSRTKPAQPTPTPTPTPAPQKIQSKIYCASIRDHPVWAPAIPLLLADRAEPRWETARLNSHDLAVHIAPPRVETVGGRTVRFALATATDVGRSGFTKTLHRLAARNGADAVVLFLLSRCDANGPTVDTMAAYRQLQHELQDTAVAILPLAAVETLPATVAAFCSQLTAAPLDPPGASSRRIHSLLRMYCGKPTVPLSVDGAKKLVAACEAETSTWPRARGATLKDVIAFCNDLKTKSAGHLERILNPEEAVHMPGL